MPYTCKCLRLIYATIARAKGNLIMTWNAGRKGETQQCMPVAALAEWLKSHQ